MPLFCVSTAFAGLQAGCTGTDDYSRPPCRIVSGGAAIVDIETAACPEIVSFDVLPTTTEVGGFIMVFPTISEPGNAQPAFGWKANSGTFVDAATEVSSFECTSPGAATLTLTVTNALCSVEGAVVVHCTPAQASTDAAVDGD